MGEEHCGKWKARIGFIHIWIKDEMKDFANNVIMWYIKGVPNLFLEPNHNVAVVGSI